MTLNRMQIIGNLGADPELRYTPSGKAVTTIRVAVNDRVRGPDGEWTDDTMWIGVDVWEQQAERIAEQLRKGNKVYAEGQLKLREYDARDGQRRTAVELKFARVVNLERRSRDDEGGFAGPESGDNGPQVPQVIPRRDPEVPRKSPDADMVDVDDIPF